MISRETRLSRMPLWFIDTPSETEMVVNGTGTAPPAATPSRAASAWGPSDIEQGVFSPCVLTMPTSGLSRSSSSSPQARRNARCGVRSRPSMAMRERYLPFIPMSAIRVTFSLLVSQPWMRADTRPGANMLHTGGLIH